MRGAWGLRENSIHETFLCLLGLFKPSLKESLKSQFQMLSAPKRTGSIAGLFRRTHIDCLLSFEFSLAWQDPKSGYIWLLS
jgi:hypothetical protein